MRNVRGIVDDLRDTIVEDQGLRAVLSAIGGAIFAVALERVGGDPDPGSFTITVEQARASLLSTLALIFTGLSIVLALTALTTQNMASRFSPRLLRMSLRGAGNKSMLAVFAFTASFIITSQVLMSSRRSDSLAPQPTMVTSVVLLVITGVAIVWYINDTIQSLRVDRTVAWIGRRIVRAADGQHRANRNDQVIDQPGVERPPGATDVVAPASGYLVGVDTDRLYHLATRSNANVMIDKCTGQPTVKGESVGWLVTTSHSPADDLGAATDCLTVAEVRNPDSDVGYTIGVLVDVALVALSPAINDPHTAVECVEILVAVFAELAERSLGVRVRRDSDGTSSVVVRDRSVGDYLDAAGRQILLYGSEDRSVTAALLRFAREGERLVRTDRDRGLARVLADDIETLRAKDGGSHGMSW